MGFRNPFRVTLDENDVAYVTDYSPDAREGQTVPWARGHRPRRDRPQAVELRLAALLQDRSRVLQVGLRDGRPAPASAHPSRTSAATRLRARQNTSKWVANGGPTVQPGLAQTPPITDPEIWYSYNDNTTNNPNGLPFGTPCANAYGPDAPPPLQNAVGTPQLCPQLFPELGAQRATERRRPARRGAVRLQPARTRTRRSSRPTSTASFFFGEFTRDYLREVRLDSQNRVFKLNDSLPCGPVPATPTRPWLCDNPMDMEFHSDGTLYLLTYGDGFFAINPDAGMMRWEYVKGQRAPVVSDLTATPTSGPAPLTVSFEPDVDRRRSGRLAPLRVGLRRQRHDRLDRPETRRTRTRRPGSPRRS